MHGFEFFFQWFTVLLVEVGGKYLIVFHFASNSSIIMIVVGSSLHFL